MSNSALICCTILSPCNSGRRNHAIDRISIHCMAGNLSVESCGNMFASRERQASSNYGIGTDGRCALYVDEANRSWCTSSSSNDNRAVTIEVANTVAAEPWPVSDAAYKTLLDLCTDICKRNGKKKLLWFGDKEKTLNYEPAPDEMVMTVHRWFAAKACPGDYLYNRHGEIAKEVTRRLNEQEDDMDKKQFKKLFDEMRADLQDNDCSEYSKEARDWAIKNGIIKGGGTLPDGEPNFMWQDMMTREQLITVLHRFAQLMGKA